MKTLDQRYADLIREQVQTIKDGKPKVEQAKYGSMAHKLPILIHTAGLAQALAFVEARGFDIQKCLLHDLAEVVQPGEKKSLLERAQQADLREYMRLNHQIMVALLWYKRFAQSILDIDASQASLEDGKDHG